MYIYIQFFYSSFCLGTATDDIEGALNVFSHGESYIADSAGRLRQTIALVFLKTDYIYSPTFSMSLICMLLWSLVCYVYINYWIVFWHFLNLFQKVFCTKYSIIIIQINTLIARWPNAINGLKKISVNTNPYFWHQK